MVIITNKTELLIMLDCVPHLRSCCEKADAA